MTSDSFARHANHSDLLAPLRQILLDAGMGSREADSWLHTPTGWLLGEVPAELIARDDERSHRRVLRAAQRVAEHIATDDEAAARNLAAFNAAMEDQSTPES